MRRRLRLAAWLIPAALALWAFVLEPRRLVVKEAHLSLPGWPSALRGLTVVALSDLHVGGAHVSLARLEDVIARVNAERPDLILLLGDFVAGHELGEVTPEAIAAPLARLSAPLGVYAVLGNHDWWVDGPRVRRALEAAGIPVIDGAARRVARGETALHLVGVADFTTRHGDPRDVLAGANLPADAPILLVTHDPTLFPEVPARVSLTIAGHTHGGQVRLPVLGAPVVPSRYGQRYAAGHVVEEGRHLYVTTGVGTSILPLRFGVPPEIARLVLD